MNFLKIKTSKNKIKINLDFKGIDNIPFFQNQDNKFDFSLALKDAIKYEADQFTSYESYNKQFYINDGPFYLECSEEKHVTDFSNILESINNNAEKIWTKFSLKINEAHPDQDYDLNTFIDTLYKCFFEEVITYNKNSDLKFLDISHDNDMIMVSMPFIELHRIENDLPSLFKNTFISVIEKQFPNIMETYYPESQLTIEKNPSLLLQSNDHNCIQYFINLLDKINKQSNKMYEIALHDLDTPPFLKEDLLVEKLTTLLNRFIETEVLDEHMPLNNSIEKKKLKL